MLLRSQKKDNPVHEGEREAKRERKGNRSVDPPSEAYFGKGIGQDGSTKPQTTWTRRAVLQLDIICRNDMREYGFHHVCGEETSRAIGQSDVQLSVIDEEMKTPYQACLPCPKGRYSMEVETNWCFAPSESSPCISANRKGRNTLGFS